MGDFGNQQSDNEWAENKKLLRYCSEHKSYFDPHLGCKYCKSEESPLKPISKAEFNPFGMVKQGYKYHAGSYWKRMNHTETEDIKGITLTDSEGIWLKVSQEEATIVLEIREPPHETKLEEQPALKNNQYKRAPIWANLYSTETNDINLNPPIIESKPTTTAPIQTPDNKNPIKRQEHPSFGEDLRRMIFGK
jgi:hypothetical protein